MELTWTIDMGRTAGQWGCKRAGFAGAALLGVIFWMAEDQGTEGPVHAVVYRVHLQYRQWDLGLI